MEFILIVVYLVVIIGLVIVPIWKVFEKAGKPGWACIVPIYGTMVMAEIGKKPSWWGLLTLIPYVGMIWGIWIVNLIAKNFGKSTGFTVGLILLPFVFWPMLGYGDAQYQGDDLSSDVSDFGQSETESNFEK